MTTTHTHRSSSQTTQTQAWRYSTELGRMELVTIAATCAVCGGQSDQCDATGRALCSDCRPMTVDASTYDERDDDEIDAEQDEADEQE